MEASRRRRGRSELPLRGLDQEGGKGALEGEPGWLVEGRRAGCVGGRHRSGHGGLKRRTKKPIAGSWEVDGKQQFQVLFFRLFRLDNLVSLHRTCFVFGAKFLDTIMMDSVSSAVS